MLVLSRTLGQEIIIGDDIRVVIHSVREGRVQLAIHAPRHMRIDRSEVRAKILAGLKPVTVGKQKAVAAPIPERPA